MEYIILNYPNGIKALLRQTKSAIVHSSITIGAASRDEKEGEFGVAHFIEHMLFKGTEKRNQYHINTLLDNGGGELNAYTTKEETVVHASTLKCDFKKGVDLIMDITFNSVFATKEIEKEREVIVDEINSYKDSPSELIFDQFEDLLFENSEIGHPILGTKKSLKKLSTKSMVDFRERTYNTNKMVFAVTGNISESRFKAICDQYIAPIQPSTREWERKAPSLYIPKTLEVKKNTYQRHILIGNRAYSHYDKDRVALALLTNIFGGQSPSSMLNQLLREKHGLTYNIEAGYTSYVDSGIFTIYLSCEEDKQQKCLELLMGEINKIKTKEFSSSRLALYKRQLLGQLAVSSENNENLMLSTARSLLLHDEVDSMKSISQKINSITSKELLEVANQILEEKQLSTLIYK